MEKKYHEITSELDAREILRYLNHLGIQNISAEVLKNFMTDLKKLIKYDLEQQKENLHQNDDIRGPERLHSASTFCSRVRSKIPGMPISSCSCTRTCTRPRKPIFYRDTHSAPNLGQQKPQVDDKPVGRSCSCVRVEKKPETVKESKGSSSSNLIKVPRPALKKKCDPVSLYHYYTSLWAKYKSNVPGENNWADLRWHVRQKMAGIAPRTKKIPDIQNHNDAAQNKK